MKSLGRILIIVAVFALVMGIAYRVVNADSSSTAAPAFERGAESFTLGGGPQAPFADSERPDFEKRGGGWIFGLIKNVGVITVIVALITIPKSLRRRKPLTARATNS